MKRFFFLLAVYALSGFTALDAQTKKPEDKSKRPSPPMTVSQTISGGARITINYGQPSVKGRTIGKDVEPMEGQVWRAGANEATTFETSKPLVIEGQPLPAGKYAFFTLKSGDAWTLIFNKTWKTWGAYEYEKNKTADALQVKVSEQQAKPFAEKLTYTISRDGQVALLWGDKKISFTMAAGK